MSQPVLGLVCNQKSWKKKKMNLNIFNQIHQLIFAAVNTDIAVNNYLYLIKGIFRENSFV